MAQPFVLECKTTRIQTDEKGERFMYCVQCGEAIEEKDQSLNGVIVCPRCDLEHTMIEKTEEA